jgi:hypothetical protein
MVEVSWCCRPTDFLAFLFSRDDISSELAVGKGANHHEWKNWIHAEGTGSNATCF